MDTTRKNAPACYTSIVLLMDSSGSVGKENWRLQYEATAAALEHPEITNAIKWSGPVAVIARSFDAPDKSSHTASRRMTDWQVIANREDAQRYAQELRSAGASYYHDGDDTRIGAAVEEVLPLFESSPCRGTRIVDVSTDGQSSFDSMRVARDKAQGLGIRVNSIFVANAQKSAGDAERYRRYLEDNLVTLDNGGFAKKAGWESYPDAIREKLKKEVALAR